MYCSIRRKILRYNDNPPITYFLKLATVSVTQKKNNYKTIIGLFSNTSF